MDFFCKTEKAKPAISKDSWKVLVVDDDPDIHKITSMVLEDFQYKEMSLDIQHAYSGKEAKEKIQQEDFSLILLDVVMESKNSGLDVVEYIRKERGEHFTRIILRTGQPGEAPEEEVIFKYEINDYLEKGDTSSTRLKTVLVNSFRNYDMLLQKEKHYKEQKRLSEKLEKVNYRLKMVNEQKSKFLTFLSHETLTPLNYINASSIIDKNSLPETERQYIDFVVTGSQKLHKVIKTIIRYFDFIGNDLELAPVSIPVREILQGILKEFREEIDSMQLDVVLELDNDFNVQFDVSYFIQITKILIDNAIKFSYSKGQLIFKGWQSGDTWYLTITDTGKGASEEKLKRVFTAYDLQNFDRHESGYGLNLPMVKYIVESHGDQVFIDSPGVEKGVTVTIRFKEKLDA